MTALEPASEQEIVAGLRQVSTATLAAVARKRGLNTITLDGLRSTKPGTSMVGYARTVRYLPLREDLSAAYGGGMNAQKRAIEAIRPGEVLVIEARGDSTAGTIGDILALRAQMRGAAGIVTDGAIRDSAALAGLDLPIYYAAVHPAVLGRRHVPWETGVTVACAGVTIQPGDLLVGDADGVVVLPPKIAADVLAEAREQERQEQFIAARVAAGESIDGLFPLPEARRPDYQAWLAQHQTQLAHPQASPAQPQASPPQPQASPAQPPPPEPHPQPESHQQPEPHPQPAQSHSQPAQRSIEPDITGSMLHRTGERASARAAQSPEPPASAGTADASGASRDGGA